MAVRPRRRGQPALRRRGGPDALLRLPWRHHDEQVQLGELDERAGAAGATGSLSACAAKREQRGLDRMTGAGARDRGGLGRARAARGVPGARPAARRKPPRRRRRSPRELRQRLRYLSDRVHGEQVAEPCAASRSPPPTASSSARSGSTRDQYRPPGEAAMLERLRAGRFRSRNIVDDALTVAVVETGVAVRAFDADRVQGELGLADLAAGRAARRGPEGLELPEGTIVIADERDRSGWSSARPPRGRGVSGGHGADRALRGAGRGRPRHQRRGGAVDLRRHPDQSALSALAGR